MSIFKSITPNDIYVTPFEVHKGYAFPSYDASSSYGIQSYQGKYQWWITNQSDHTNTIADALETTTNGEYKYVIHNSINHMFYNRYRYDPLGTLSKSNINQRRELHERVNVLSIPQNLFSEKIKENTVNVTDYSYIGQSIIPNSTFASGTLGWNWTTHPVGASGTIVYAPIEYHGEYSYGAPTGSIADTKMTFIAANVHDISGSSIYETDIVQHLYITASMTNGVYVNQNYKLVVDIAGFSYNSDVYGEYVVTDYMDDDYAEGNDTFSTINIDISASIGTSIPTIFVPLEIGRFELDFTPTETADQATFILSATQHIQVPPSTSLDITYVSASYARVTFNEISLFVRNQSSRQFLDDGYGNLYDVASENVILDDMADHLVGEWNFNDGYIDARDENRQHFAEDTSIYMNHGICTDIEFVDGIYGKSAKFDKIRGLSYIISGSDTYTRINANLASGSVLDELTFSTMVPPINPMVSFPSIDFPHDDQLFTLYHNYQVPITLTSSDVSIQKYGLSGLSETKMYHISFWSKSTYMSQSLMSPQIVGVSLMSGSVIGYSDTQEMFGYWHKHDFYACPSASVISNCTMSINLQYPENILPLNSDDDKLKKIYISTIRMQEVKQGSNIRIQHNDIFNFYSWDKFAIECIVKPQIKQYNTKDGDYNIIMTKNGRRKSYINNPNQTYRNQLHNDTSGSSWYLGYDEMNIDEVGRFPYQIAINNQKSSMPGAVRVSRHDGNAELIMTSSVAINDYKPHHIMFQKTGSLIQLFVDGVYESSAADYTAQRPSDCGDRLNAPTITNLSDLFIGCRGDDRFNFRGEVECVRIYNDAFTSTRINDLYLAQVVNKNYHYRVGNVFYEQGFITVTNPYSRYADTFIYTGSANTAAGYQCSFNGALTYYEVEVHCPVEAAEYNYTLNRTVRAQGNIENDRIACFATHSEFSPYVTTVGLYNENLEMVAIGKISKPIKKLNNVDTTFIIKFDA